MNFINLLKPIGIDFPIFYDASSMLWDKLNFYKFLTLSSGPFNYPPTSFLFLWWLGLLPFDLAGAIWNLASVGSLVLSIYLILKIASKKVNFWLLGFSTLIFTIPFFPVKHNLASGQINNFILLFTVSSIFLYFKGKKRLSAGMLAFGAGIKLVPAVFLLFFLIKRDFRTIAWFIVSLVLLEVVALILIPWEMQKVYFTEVFFQGFPLSGKEIYYNQSLLGFLARAFDQETTVRIFQYALSAVLVFITLIRGQKISDIRAISAVSCLYLILHPLAWQHHFVFAVVPIILLGTDIIRSKIDLLDRKKWLLFFFFIFSYILIAWNIKQPQLVSQEFHFFLSHQFFGVLILWVIALFKENFWKVLAIIWMASLTVSYFSVSLCHARICL